jgi:hypothetical protein
VEPGPLWRLSDRPDVRPESVSSTTESEPEPKSDLSPEITESVRSADPVPVEGDVASRKVVPVPVKVDWGPSAYVLVTLDSGPAV